MIDRVAKMTANQEESANSELVMMHSRFQFLVVYGHNSRFPIIRSHF
jgi:hypothetical protein